MPEPLKNMYNRQHLQDLAARIKVVYQPFMEAEFVDAIMDETWESLELKARGRQITLNLGKFLPQDYKTAIAVLDAVVETYGSWLDALVLYFPDFVEVFGQDDAHWDISMAALEKYTKHASAEFAVRPFIINHEKRMMAQMLAWAKHENEDVRRLASEGCRPALPWGQALTSFKKDPSPIMPILELLKNDPAMYVRKSVANNLNDISKTHPDLVVKIAKEWYGKSEDVDWVVKHACRTLLKKANRDVLSIFGFGNSSDVDVTGVKIETPVVKMGEDLVFTFEISVAQDTKIRLEYGIDYMKANGKQSRKVFQISEFVLPAGKVKKYEKSHSFANVSTRKHYPGAHAVALIVNGVPHDALGFDVEA